MIKIPVTPASVGAPGMHWEMHGTSIETLPTFSHGRPQLFAVHSQQHPRRAQGRAHVVLEGTTEPFNLVLRLSPDEATSMAHRLLAAAERARQIDPVAPVLQGSAA